jgi:glyoxylate reductase
LAKLAETAEIIRPTSRCRSDFLHELQTSSVFTSVASVDTTVPPILAVYRTFDSFSISGRVDVALIKHLPKTVKSISHVGAGYDQVDVQACTDAGILVSNTPNVVDDSTADTAIFLILGALRLFNPGLTSLRAGEWRGKSSPQGMMPLGHDPRGKTLGILGMGGIGRNIRDKAAVFGFKITYYNRNRLSPDLEKDAKYVDFDTLLKTSDVIAVSTPLNNNTRHLISKAEFAKMKDGVVIVNTARGAIIDEDALVNALNSGKVASAGLDVYEDEPSVRKGLLEDKRVMLIPHMGTWTVEVSHCLHTTLSGRETFRKYKTKANVRYLEPYRRKP